MASMFDVNKILNLFWHTYEAKKSLSDLDEIVALFLFPHLTRASIFWCSEWFYKVGQEDQMFIMA